MANLIKQKDYFIYMTPVVLIFLFIIFFLLSSKPSPEQQGNTKITPSYSDRVIPISTFPSQAKEGVFDAKAQERQERGEKAFAKSQSDISRNYPWYDQLPIKSTDYFVFFDVDKKSFTGNLYPANTSKNFIVSQVVKMKARIRKSLADLSIDYAKYPFIWNIKPENKKIIGDDIIAIDKRPGLIKKESFNNNVAKYTFTSSLPDRPNIITTQNNNIIFQRTQVDTALSLQISDYTISYGSPKLVFKGSNNYGAQAQSYIYPDLGVAFIANPQTGEVFEQQIFSPTKAEDYINKYGDDIPAQP